MARSSDRSERRTRASPVLGHRRRPRRSRAEARRARQHHARASAPASHKDADDECQRLANRAERSTRRGQVARRTRQTPASRRSVGAPGPPLLQLLRGDVELPERGRRTTPRHRHPVDDDEGRDRRPAPAVGEQPKVRTPPGRRCPQAESEQRRRDRGDDVPAIREQRSCRQRREQREGRCRPQPRPW